MVTWLYLFILDGRWWPCPHPCFQASYSKCQAIFPLDQGSANYSPKAKNGFYIFERWKKQRICDKVNMPPAKSSLLPSPLQYIRAHPYSLSSREKGGQLPVHKDSTTGCSLWDWVWRQVLSLSLVVKVGGGPVPPFFLSYCKLEILQEHP